MRLVPFFESLFWHPKLYHRLVSWILIPISLLYGLAMRYRRLVAKQTSYPIPIISIGNLTVGGSGKTPFAIELANRYTHMGVAIISRGYGRQSQGLVEVSHRGRIISSVEESGDEPMLMALSLPYASVIVSEDRAIAIERAIESGVGLIILDDGFNRVEIEKLEILLEPKEIPNRLPLPSGPYRELPSTKKFADIVAVEDVDFSRVVSYKNLYEKMVLLTAIANPRRLDEYLPDGVVEKIYLDDHAYFYEETIAELIEYHNADSIIVTQKDMVKMSEFKLPISLIKLKLQINDNIYEEIDDYLKDFDES